MPVGRLQSRSTRAYWSVALVLLGVSCAPNPSPSPSCAFRVTSATSQRFGGGGGTGVVSAVTGTSCEWRAQPDVASALWIRVPGSTQRGEQTIGFTVASVAEVPQLQLPRTGEIVVSSRSRPSDSWERFSAVVVQQTGPACTYASTSPVTQVFSASGGTSTISVDTESFCDWYAEESANGEDWISVNVQTRSGSGTTNYSVAPADRLPQVPIPRSAEIFVYGRTVRDQLERVLTVRIEQR
jgi:hypothetical protein